MVAPVRSTKASKLGVGSGGVSVAALLVSGVGYAYCASHGLPQNALFQLRLPIVEPNDSWRAHLCASGLQAAVQQFMKRQKVIPAWMSVMVKSDPEEWVFRISFHVPAEKCGRVPGLMRRLQGSLPYLRDLGAKLSASLTLPSLDRHWKLFPAFVPGCVPALDALETPEQIAAAGRALGIAPATPRYRDSMSFETSREIREGVHSLFGFERPSIDPADLLRTCYPRA